MLMTFRRYFILQNMLVRVILHYFLTACRLFYVYHSKYSRPIGLIEACMNKVLYCIGVDDIFSFSSTYRPRLIEIQQRLLLWKKWTYRCEKTRHSTDNSIFWHNANKNLYGQRLRAKQGFVVGYRFDNR